MIYFLHGEDQTNSRQKMLDLLGQSKKLNKEIIKINGLNADLNTIIQALETTSLLGQEKIVVIENLFSRTKSAIKDKIVKYLKKETIGPDLIFWEKKIISGTILRWLPKNWQYQVFKTSAIIFKFLDSLKPNNQTITIKLLKEVISQESAEMAFYMLGSRIRDLIIAKNIGRQGLKGAPWQIGKLIHQASFFNLKQLKNIYQQLLAIDTGIKTGESLMPLDWHLDLLIVNL